MSDRLVQNALLALWSLVLFAGCFELHTRHARFPFFYHMDEPGKVEQVLTGQWNFNHPMLLLSASKLAVEVLQPPRKEQAVVETGRRVSAAFMAAGIVGLSLLAFVWRGWPGALTAGLVLGLHHQLYELAHYMKEDSAMFMGLALSFLAAALYWQNPTRGRALFLGVACALAVSGKYLGVLSLAIVLPVLWQKRCRWSGALFAGAFVLTFAVINLPLLMQLGVFEKSLGREMHFVVEGQKGMTRSVPHSQYWSVFLDNTTPAIWLFLGIFLYARWRDRGSISPAEWSVILFPFAYALALSFSPKSNDRYFLPATALFSLLAVLGIEDAAHLLGRWWSRRLVLFSGAALLIVFQLTGWSHSRAGLLRYEEAFRHDDLKDLIQWVKTELPPEAVIAKDNRVGLPAPSKKKKKQAQRLEPIAQKVLAAKFAADLGTLAELRQKGVTHVAVSESDYGKFFLNGLRPQKSEAAEFERRKLFYEELFRGIEAELIWERERGTMIYLHPGLKVYRLRPPLPLTSAGAPAN